MISDAFRREAIGTGLIVRICPGGHEITMHHAIVRDGDPLARGLAYYCPRCQAIIEKSELREALKHDVAN